MGLPAVGVRRFGAKELIDEGKNGLLAEPGDVAGLAVALDRLLEDDDLCKRMGKNAEKSSLKYSLEKSISRTMEIYRELLKKKVN
jgi:glycosyltransferase involved in cell wall biosynthesis